MRHRSLTIVTLLGALLFTTHARAETASEQAAAADHLFQEALELMRAGSFAAACPKLQKSLDLDPATGTHLNLALCYEAIGRTASAWSQFNAVASKTKRSSPPRPDRVKTAQEHADALAPKLSYLTVVVAPAARAQKLTVKVDGAEWIAGESLPADPGAKSIEASAPGYKTYRASASLVGEGAKLTVTIPALEALPPEPGAPVEARDGGGGRTFGWIATGVGVAALATGGVFGALALGKNADSKQCPADPSCTKDHAYVQANAYAWIADVAIPAGAVLAGVGIYFVLTSKSAPPRSALRVTATPSGGGAAWTRAW